MSGRDRRVLFVVSAATEMLYDDGTTFRTGYWGSEFWLPFAALRDAGYEIHVASPGGLEPVVDPVSLGEGEAALEPRRELDRVQPLHHPRALEAIDPELYRALVLPGGYAPMVDLASSPEMARILRSAHERGTLVAAICHAAAALLSVCEEQSPWLFAGYRMVAFTNAEEQAWLGDKRLAWQVEDALRAAGAEFCPGEVWASQVVVDRNLLTAQNSPSCPAFTRALVERLSD